MKLFRLIFSLIKKLWGWILADEIRPLSFSELEPIALPGNFKLGYSLGKYRENNRKRTKLGKLVYHFKYKKNKKAGEILVDLSSQLLQQNYPDFDVIVSVPPAIASTHFFANRFFSESLSDRVQKPLENKLIQRIRFTTEQKDFRNLTGKKGNVKDSFKISEPDKLKGKTVLLIDDIYDSGATVNEISGLLKSALARKVFVFTIAKTGFYD
ncbi:MAG: hypothetical protein A2145_02370 [candidate division Zixibacteria bacterium RBG_16_40_9]|nr:MAG: hypothetical protein A2145_02370 [candidate division Zixibacteria bacterium RBG_16_40_9]